MSEFRISRRQFVHGAGAMGASGLLAGASTPALAAGVTLGIVYVGPRDDFGWNQAHRGLPRKSPGR